MEQQRPERMLRRFVGVGAVTRVTELGAGHVNRTWRVETDADAYICQRLSRSALGGAADALEHNYRLYAAACDAARAELPDWTPPRWLRTEDGGFFCRDERGDAWRAYPMIRGRTFDTPDLPDAETIRRFARGLTALHLVLDRFAAPPRTVIPHFHDLAHYYAAYREARESERAVPAVNARVEREMRGFTGAPLLRQDAVIHADTRIGNAIFGADGGVIAFIDIDTISAGCRLIDAADSLRSVSCVRTAEGGRFDRAAFDAFVGALAGSPYRRPSAAELDALPAYLLRVTFELGLRYYTDYLRGNVYFRVSEPEETLRRALAQLALLDEIRKAL